VTQRRRGIDSLPSDRGRRAKNSEGWGARLQARGACTTSGDMPPYRRLGARSLGDGASRRPKVGTGGCSGGTGKGATQVAGPPVAAEQTRRERPKSGGATRRLAPSRGDGGRWTRARRWGRCHRIWTVDSRNQLGGLQRLGTERGGRIKNGEADWGLVVRQDTENWSQLALTRH